MPVHVNNLPPEFCWVQLYYIYLGPANTTAYVRGKVTPQQERQTGEKNKVLNETSKDPKAENQQSSSSRGDGDYSLDAAERRSRTVDTGEASRA